MSTAGRYREKRRKTITAPSGDVFIIRKPGRDSYMKLLDAQDLRDQMPDFNAKTENVDPETGKLVGLDEESQNQLKAMMTLMDEVLVRCIVDPKVALEATEDRLAIDEIDLPDYFMLIKEVFAFANLSEQKIKELFPDQQQQPGTPSGELSSSGESEAKPDPPTGEPTG